MTDFLFVMASGRRTLLSNWVSVVASKRAMQCSELKSRLAVQADFAGLYDTQSEGGGSLGSSAEDLGSPICAAESDDLSD